MASAYIRKDSPFWWVNFQTPDGSRKGKSTGVRVGSKGAVRRVQMLIVEAQTKEMAFADDGGEALFRNWVSKWIVYRNEKATTRTRYLHCWANLAVFFKMKGISHPAEVTYQLCHEYIRWRMDNEENKRQGRRRCSSNTAHTEVRCLGGIMREAVQRSFITSNPCAQLRLKRRNETDKREILADEIKRIETLLLAEPEWMRNCWLVAIKQGCRISETAIPVSRIKANVIEFHVKGGKLHYAPMHEDLKPLLKKASKRKSKMMVELNHNPSRSFSNFFKKHGFEGLTFHSTRVTVVTRLARAGYSEVQTMEYVGQCSSMVHSIYRKLRPDDLRHLGDAL